MEKLNNRIRLHRFHVLVYWFRCKAKTLEIDLHEYELDKSLAELQERMESDQLIKQV